MDRVARHLLCGLLIFLTGGTLPAQSTDPAAAEARTALIMGVGDYTGTSFPKLPGIDKDLERMKAALEKTGFTVTVLSDPNLTQAEKAVDEFGAALRTKKGVGLFYFSGHGGELEGQNFLIPKGARISEHSDIKLQALAAQRVLGRMETSGARVSMMFLDACRNDMTKAATNTGLAPMNVKGTFIGFATAAEKLSNATAEGSPYTAVLAEMIQKPGLSVSDMHTLVNARVQEETKNAPGGQQVPFQYSGLNSLFYFQPGTVQDSGAEMAELKKQLEEMKRAAAAGNASAPRKASSSSDPAAPFTNTLGMKFVSVPGTTVQFCIHETRSKDFAAFIADKNRGYTMEGEDADAWRTGQVEGIPVGRGATERAENSDHPVAFVSWLDATAFCAWLSRKEGKSYRLPTDAEWSAAVGLNEEQSSPEALHGKIQDVYPWGRNFSPVEIEGNYADVTAKERNCVEAKNCITGYRDSYATTAPVKQFAPNPFGLYDLGGNLVEWCAGQYDGADPKGRDKSQPKKTRSTRGGSWASGLAVPLQSSFRFQNQPANRLNWIGFRVVLVVSGD